MLKKIVNLEKMVHRKIVHHEDFCYWLKLIYVLNSVTPCIQLKQVSRIKQKLMNNLKNFCSKFVVPSLCMHVFLRIL
jgi:hypothetical protein